MQAGARWDSIKHPLGPSHHHMAPLVRVCLLHHTPRTWMDEVQSNPHSPHVHGGLDKLLAGAHLCSGTLLPSSRDRCPDVHRHLAHLLCRKGDGAGPGGHLRGSVSAALSHSPPCLVVFSWSQGQALAWPSRGPLLYTPPHQCPKLLCRSCFIGLPGSLESPQLLVLGRVENPVQDRVPASCSV